MGGTIGVLRFWFVRAGLGGLLLLGGSAWPVLEAAVVISEIMAARGNPLADVDRDRSDWIEIHNTGTEPVPLQGWQLTDRLDAEEAWTFPDVTLDPKGFVIVFASGKDYLDPNGEIHASFRLRQSGEPLRLLDPAAQVQSSFTPSFPAQYEGFSYGREMRSSVVSVIGSQSPVHFLVPTADNDDLPWREVDFDHSAWFSATGTIGYDGNTPPVYASHIHRDVSDQVSGKGSSVFVRYPFVIPSGIGQLRLDLRYDDGCVVYLNGRELLRRNTPRRVDYRSRASTERPPQQVLRPETVIVEATDGLRRGPNVVAVHLLNLRATDRDLFLSVHGDFVAVPDGPLGASGYFVRPSPGLPNARPLIAPMSPPRSSLASGTYGLGTAVVLSAPVEGGVIHYTVDGTVPSWESPKYTEPLTLNRSAIVRARASADGRTLGRMATWHYVIGDSSLEGISSNLPIVIMDSMEQRISPKGPSLAIIHIYDRGENGRTVLDNAPVLSEVGTLKVRGSSTEGRPKKAYNVEFQDAYGDDLDREVLGMPADSDWILYAPYNFDRALLRNAFVYEVSNQLGMYAVRTRFCEVYLNSRRGTPLAQRSYQGVYVLMEKIKRGRDRVDVERLLAKHHRRPDVSGGYILKIDRLDPGDGGFSAGGQGLAHVYPKEDDRTSAQLSFLRGHINGFDRAVRGASPTDPARGYPRYIDVNSFVDFHMLNEFTKNPDGLRLSTYMHIPRHGKLTMGPVWDFDRTMGPDDDSRAANPNGRSSVYHFGWWGRLFQVPDFAQRYTDRWQAWRQTVMTEENLLGMIDRMSEEVAEAQERNFDRWRLVSGTPGWRREVTQLKSWIQRRLAWFDRQFLEQPVPNLEPGVVPRGTRLQFDSGDDVVFVTLDGSDPRLSGGDPSRSATTLKPGDEIPIDRDTMVVARVRREARRGYHWSGPFRGVYNVNDVPAIEITEVMYHPSAADAGSQWSESDFEFLELRSGSSQPVHLVGARFREGITLEWTSLTLAPEQTVVVVRNRDAFESRYPDAAGHIVGEYDGSLANRGETIVLEDAHGRLIAEVSYEDRGDWDRSADGDGFSLERLPGTTDPNSPGSWRASPVIGGSPGRVSSEPIAIVDWKVEGQRFELTFQGRAGGRYEIRATSGGAAPEWQTVAEIQLEANESTGQASLAMDQAVQWFRVIER